MRSDVDHAFDHTHLSTRALGQVWLKEDVTYVEPELTAPENVAQLVNLFTNAESRNLENILEPLHEMMGKSTELVQVGRVVRVLC